MKGMELDLLSWFGIKCSSLVAVNSGTSKRSACNSIGLSCPSVDESNTLLERTEEHMCQPLCFFFLTSESPNSAFRALAGPYAFACWWRRSKECGCWSSQDLAFSNFTLLGFIFSMPSTNGMEWKVLGPQFRISEHMTNKGLTLQIDSNHKKSIRYAGLLGGCQGMEPRALKDNMPGPTLRQFFVLMLAGRKWNIQFAHATSMWTKMGSGAGMGRHNSNAQSPSTEHIPFLAVKISAVLGSGLLWNIRKVYVLNSFLQGPNS